MVLVLSIPPNEAIKRFAEARGYEIERENYISSIKLHDANSILKQTANTLPVLIPKTQLAIKRVNETEIDSQRYDDRKRRNFNSGAFSKSNAEHSQRYNHGSSRSRIDEGYRYMNDSRDTRHYERPGRSDDRSRDSRYRRNYDTSSRSWRNPSHTSRRHDFDVRSRKPYQRTSRPRERSYEESRRSRSEKNYHNKSDQR